MSSCAEERISNGVGRFPSTSVDDDDVWPFIDFNDISYIGLILISLLINQER